jgi:ribonuclease R
MLEVTTDPPKKRGRPRKAQVSDLTTQPPLLENGFSSDAELAVETGSVEAAEPVKPKVRGRKGTPKPETLEMPKARARGRKTSLSDPETSVQSVGETRAEPPVEAVTIEPPPIPAEPSPVKSKARGRKAASEPVIETPKPRARGRKVDAEPVPEEPRTLQVTAQEPDLETPRTDMPDMPRLEGESAPEAVASPKRLVRVRKTARENVFETQAKLTNPLESLLEYLRANPGSHAMRDLEKELEDELLKRLGGRKGLEDALESLLRLGALVQVKRHTYGLAREVNAVVGRLTVRPDGWGVLYPDTPGLREMMIAPEALLHAWHGDRAVARELKRNGESYGRVIRVIERRCDTVVGTVEFTRGALGLRPDDSRLPRLPLEPTDVNVGARVVVTPRYPESTGEDDAFGVVTRVLGATDALETERWAIQIKCDLRQEFPADATKEAQKVAGVGVKDLQGRVDLRSKRVIAASNAEGGPLEVGVQAEPLGNGNVLIGIHVADAQYFVDEGKALDAEALARGVTVNLAGETLPLLPEVVVNSATLQVGADRLALSVLVEASPDGNVVNYIVRQSVVNAKARLEDGLPDAERELLERLTNGLRVARGASSSTLLEELLLLANRLAAATLASNEVIALYRYTPPYSHDLEFALERSGGATPAMLAALREAHAQKPQLIATKYPELEHHLELTRPLTRYADLQNGRILSLLVTKLSTRKRELLEENLPGVAAQLTALEFNAARAERDLEAYIRAQSITEGAFVKGIVTGVDPWGLDFALENGAKARLAMQDMDEEYLYTDAPRSLKGRTGRVFKPGSIARAHVIAAGRSLRLSLGKENLMSKQKRPKGTKPTSDAPRRQVVVLHAKPRGEYQRGVRVTARKLYFGEWSRAQFVASDEFGGEIALERPQQERPQQNRSFQRDGSRPQHAARNANPAQQQAQRGDRPQQGQRHNQNQPRSQQPQQNAQTRASRIAELKRRADTTLERNAERAKRGPAEGGSTPRATTPRASAPRPSAAQPSPAQPSPAQPSAPATPRADNATPTVEAANPTTRNRRRRRGGRGNKAPTA